MNKRGTSIRFEGAWTEAARRAIEGALLATPEVHTFPQTRDVEGWLCLCGHVDGRLYYLAREAASRSTFEADSAEHLAEQIEQHVSGLGEATSPRVRLLLLEAHGDVPIEQHPDVAPWLEQDWQIKSVTPRVIETLGPRQLVVLTPPSMTMSHPDA